MVHRLHTDSLRGNIQEQRHLQLCPGPLRNSQPFQYVLKSIIQTVSYVLPVSCSARLQARKVNLFLQRAGGMDGKPEGSWFKMPYHGCRLASVLCSQPFSESECWNGGRGQ